MPELSTTTNNEVLILNMNQRDDSQLPQSLLTSSFLRVKPFSNVREHLALEIEVRLTSVVLYIFRIVYILEYHPFFFLFFYPKQEFELIFIFIFLM